MTEQSKHNGGTGKKKSQVGTFYSPIQTHTTVSHFSAALEKNNTKISAFKTILRFCINSLYSSYDEFGVAN